MNRYSVEVISPSSGYGSDRLDEVIECKYFQILGESIVFYDKKDDPILIVPSTYSIVKLIKD